MLKIKHKTLELFLILLLPNLLLFVVAYNIGINRSFINIDYFIPLIFLMIGRYLLFVISYIALYTIDFLVGFFQVFPVVRLENLFYLFKFFSYASIGYQIFTLIVVFNLFILIWFLHKHKKVLTKQTFLVLLNVLIYIYIASYFIFDNSVGFRSVQAGIVSSKTQELIKMRNSNFTEQFDKVEKGLLPLPSTHKSLTNMVVNSKDSKILFILNESWGLTGQPKFDDQILAALYHNSHIQVTDRGNFSFTGFTVEGELRELCRSKPVSFNLKEQIQGFETCLPNKFIKQGYKTISLHGAVGPMYDRMYWYKHVGFKTSYFMENFPSFERCFSFPGLCDQNLLNEVPNLTKSSDKVFLYFLTLNTHKKYDLRDLKTKVNFECGLFKLNEDFETCRNAKLQTQFFDNLSIMLKDSKMKGFTVYVVGDHAPPITEESPVNFYKDRVPYVIFKVV